MNHKPKPRRAGSGACSMCGSKRAHIEWDAGSRSWFCVLRDEVPREPKRRATPPARPEPPEPRLPALACDRCGAVLLGGAAGGVSAYCGRCRRWVVQPGLEAEP